MVPKVESTIENFQIGVNDLQFQLKSFQTLGPTSNQDHSTYHWSQLASELAANSCRRAGDQNRATGEITGAHSDDVSRKLEEFKKFEEFEEFEEFENKS